MLGDIVCSTQLLVTHLVMTFSPYDNHGIRGTYLTHVSFDLVPNVKISMLDRPVCLDGLLGRTIKHLRVKACSFCFLEPLARPAHLP